jgi:hypothetical protein
MGFRVVRLGRQHLLVEPDGLVRLSVVLVPDGLAEQTAGGLQRCSSGVSADALALHPHGAALLSVHPKVPAAGDQSVIAACACSVEQATGRIGFALREMWEKKTTRAYKAFVSCMDATDRLCPRRRRRLSRRLGRNSQRRISANLLVARADSGTIRRINFALR